MDPVSSLDEIEMALQDLTTDIILSACVTKLQSCNLIYSSAVKQHVTLFHVVERSFSVVSDLLTKKRIRLPIAERVVLRSYSYSH
ncbi:hypothetical protein T11_11424 [Trichinella zimbabwensis]|uniref:Uncharacterized protein n=1 Tax=Trichinella zimbabwensis TaxID=268475 RepID=A0A0V1HHB8_9BILA|nr:hypothetical protein T11_11424 [Trichinella zimbabwensis]